MRRPIAEILREADFPGAYLGAALAIFLTALCASVVPALRGSRVDPARVMRSE